MMMKRKRTWKRCLCVLLTLTLLAVTPRNAFGAEKPEWRYEDSILVSITVDESKAFSPEDFPGIDCKKVFVLEKLIHEQDDISYQLVLMLNSPNDAKIKESIEKLLTLPGVTHVKKNYEYVPYEAYLTLSRSYLYLSVGETADVVVKDVDFGRNRNHILGIRFRPDPEFFDPDSFQKDTFSQYGISRFWPEIQGTLSRILEPDFRPEELEAQKSEGGAYYGLSGAKNESIFDTFTHMAASPEISSVYIATERSVGTDVYTSLKYLNTTGSSFDDDTVIEKREDEWWTIGNANIAAYSLSVGADTPWITHFDKATIQGLEAGITRLTCERSLYDAYVSSDCTIIVYEPDSKNNPGDINHDGSVSVDDALQVLEHIVGLISLEEDSIRTADLDQDNNITVADALLMLKITVGLL